MDFGTGAGFVFLPGTCVQAHVGRCIWVVPKESHCIKEVGCVLRFNNVSSVTLGGILESLLSSTSGEFREFRFYLRQVAI